MGEWKQQLAKILKEKYNWQDKEIKELIEKVEKHHYDSLHVKGGGVRSKNR